MYSVKGWCIPPFLCTVNVYSVVRSSLLTAYIDKPVCYVHTTRVHYRTYSTDSEKYNQFSCDLCLSLFRISVPPQLMTNDVKEIIYTQPIDVPTC